MSGEEVKVKTGNEEDDVRSRFVKVLAQDLLNSNLDSTRFEFRTTVAPPTAINHEVQSPESVALWLKANMKKDNVFEGSSGFILFFERGQTEIEEVLAYAARKSSVGVTPQDIKEFMEAFYRAGVFIPPPPLTEEEEKRLEEARRGPKKKLIREGRKNDVPMLFMFRV